MWCFIRRCLSLKWILSEEKAEEPAEDEAATEEDADVEVQLDAIEEPVEDVDKE